MTNENIDRLVTKAHFLVGAPEVDKALIRGIIKWMTDADTLASLMAMIDHFHTAFFQRQNEGQRKKQNVGQNSGHHLDSPTRQSRRPGWLLAWSQDELDGQIAFEQ